MSIFSNPGQTLGSLGSGIEDLGSAIFTTVDPFLQRNETRRQQERLTEAKIAQIKASQAQAAADRARTISSNDTLKSVVKWLGITVAASVVGLAVSAIAKKRRNKRRKK